MLSIHIRKWHNDYCEFLVQSILISGSYSEVVEKIDQYFKSNKELLNEEIIQFTINSKVIINARTNPIPKCLLPFFLKDNCNPTFKILNRETEICSISTAKLLKEYILSPQTVDIEELHSELLPLEEQYLGTLYKPLYVSKAYLNIGKRLEYNIIDTWYEDLEQAVIALNKEPHLEDTVPVIIKLTGRYKMVNPYPYLDACIEAVLGYQQKRILLNTKAYLQKIWQMDKFNTKFYICESKVQ